jgi:hypothetical protein
MGIITLVVVMVLITTDLVYRVCRSNATLVTPTPTPVKGIDLAVSPNSIARMPCGISLTVMYTVTFHVPADNPGRSVDLQYCMNGGRTTHLGSVTIQPGKTASSYTL